MRRHELTKKKTMTKTNTKTKTNTFREHLQRATLETFDLWDIWSDEETWPDQTKTLTKAKTKTTAKTKTMTKTNTFREHLQRAILETCDYCKFDQGDKETWPDQKKTITKTNTKTKTMTNTNTLREHLKRAIPETCDLWDNWSVWWGDMTPTHPNSPQLT